MHYFNDCRGLTNTVRVNWQACELCAFCTERYREYMWRAGWRP